MSKPSEFGGKVQKNGFQPEVPTDAESPRYGWPARGGHTLTASEQLSLVYGTGQDEDPTMDRDAGTFRGNLPKDQWEQPAPPEQGSI